MDKYFSRCDWCKKSTFVEKLTYLDGFSNYTCKECKQIAKLDIRRYNLEMQQTKVTSQAH